MAVRSRFESESFLSCLITGFQMSLWMMGRNGEFCKLVHLGTCMDSSSIMGAFIRSKKAATAS